MCSTWKRICIEDIPKKAQNASVQRAVFIDIQSLHKAQDSYDNSKVQQLFIKRNLQSRITAPLQYYSCKYDLCMFQLFHLIFPYPICIIGGSIFFPSRKQKIKYFKCLNLLEKT